MTYNRMPTSIGILIRAETQSEACIVHTTNGLTDLYWLPDPQDWDRRLAALKEPATPDDAWRELVALSRTRLDVSRTNRLDRALRAHFGEQAPPGLQTRPVRLAVLSSSTVGHMLPGLRIGALRRGIWLTAYAGDYGQYFQELLTPSSSLAAFAPTDVLLSFDAHHLTRGLHPGAGQDDVTAHLERALSHLADCWRLSRQHFGAAVIQQTALPIFRPLLGNAEHRLPGSPLRFVERLNEAIRGAARDVEVLALDHWCAIHGLAAWHQPSMWLNGKQEIAPTATPLYGDLVGRIVAAQQGRAYKALVLDLDNTLWGGVIGDDGLNGIVIGPGSASGESFLALQSYAKDLARRGVILAVCSKNDEQNARLPFADHPDMVLRMDDIAAFVANWDDKVQNIRRIAEILNIGLDALVFVDDNPFERNLVRAELPMVAVPEVPEDAVLVAACLADAGYFEGLRVTADDQQRVAQYKANEARSVFAAQAADLESFLRGMEMCLYWRPFDRDGLARITQLINKTNQFNLTTRRFTEVEVEAVMSDPAQITLQLRLTDRFGDNGTIAIVMARCVGETCLIDVWLMSCRVLGRQVEQATLQVLAAQAKAHGVSRLIGAYKPSAKNAMVKEHYATLGFRLDHTDPDGTTNWSLDLTDRTPPELLMRIERG